MILNRKKHWETIYKTKALTEVSWYQPTPTDSLEFLKLHQIEKTAAIIDIGAGDSFFVDQLLANGYQNITVLDISEKAIERAQNRLGSKATLINWIISDVIEFEPKMNYDFWHDRASFHFLTSENEIQKYLTTVRTYLNIGGIITLGTFSKEGPKKCSGIEISQYSEASMSRLFTQNFKKISCKSSNHTTPFKTIQHFIFCSFQKLK